mgnify:CR=1 FL=1
MDLKKLIKAKEKLNYSSVDIAARSGVPVSTVYKIFQGTTENPRKETIGAIERVLGLRSEEPAPDALHEDTFYGGYNLSSNARIPDYPIKKQGEYTTEDLDEYPNDIHVELIDGVIYDMAAPKVIHQILISELNGEFRNYIRRNKGSCVIMSEPGVHLDCDNRTEVQPDLAVVCDRSRFKNGHIFGAPDLIVEILSPSNRKHDTIRKRNKYRSAGVKEYWIVDPEEKIILVHLFGDNYHLQAYTFRDSVPVSIWDGAFAVDFAEIDDYITDIFGEAEDSDSEEDL